MSIGSHTRHGYKLFHRPAYIDETTSSPGFTSTTITTIVTMFAYSNFIQPGGFRRAPGEMDGRHVIWLVHDHTGEPCLLR